MDAKNRWRDFGVVALIAVGLGAADAWSHRTPASCPACEFEALRAVRTPTDQSSEATRRRTILENPDGLGKE